MRRFRPLALPGSGSLAPKTIVSGKPGSSFDCTLDAKNPLLLSKGLRVRSFGWGSLLTGAWSAPIVPNAPRSAIEPAIALVAVQLVLLILLELSALVANGVAKVVDGLFLTR